MYLPQLVTNRRAEGHMHTAGRCRRDRYDQCAAVASRRLLAGQDNK